jgi:hypothetical protein
MAKFEEKSRPGLKGKSWPSLKRKLWPSLKENYGQV